MDTIVWVIIVVVAAAAACFGGFLFGHSKRIKDDNGKIRNAEVEAEKIKQEAIKVAETKKKEAALEAKRRREAISEAERKAIEAEVDAEERRNGWFRVHAKGSLVAHGFACPKSVKKKNAAKRKAEEERAKKYAKNKKKK